MFSTSKALLVLLVVLLSSAFCARVRYDNWKVISIANYTETDDAYEFSEKFGGTVWGKDRVLKTVSIVVPPESVKDVLSLPKDTRIIIDNVQELFDEEQNRLANPKPDADFFDDYRDQRAVDAWINGLEGVQVKEFGKSLEGRAINVVVLGTGPLDIFLIGTIHAREWITTTTSNWIIDQLLRPENADLLQKFTWHIAPITNPDGFDYCWTNDRMWRKNRRVNAGSTARGVDLNRNFAKGFGGGGSSGSPSSGSYRGPSPFSEDEAQAIRDYAIGLGSSLVGYIDIHCCGNMWMHPWGYDCNTYPPDNDALNKCGRAGVQGIVDAGGEVWRQGTVCQVIYQASGITTDWVYDPQGVKFSYTIEESGSFVQPPSNIPIAGRQVFSGVKSWANCIADDYASRVN